LNYYINNLSVEDIAPFVDDLELTKEDIEVLYAEFFTDIKFKITAIKGKWR
jgi:hypothetical protein